MINRGTRDRKKVHCGCMIDDGRLNDGPEIAAPMISGEEGEGTGAPDAEEKQVDGIQNSTGLSLSQRKENADDRRCRRTGGKAASAAAAGATRVVRR